VRCEWVVVCQEQSVRVKEMMHPERNVSSLGSTNLLSLSRPIQQVLRRLRTNLIRTHSGPCETCCAKDLFDSGSTSDDQSQ
jgi:hypothetical protein